MAEKYMFFNSTLEDRRKHQASDIAEYWASFLSSGLIHTNGKPTLRVSSNGEDMNISVDLGKAVMLGHLYINDSPLTKTIRQSTASEDRFDRVVLRLDLSIENRYIKVFIKEGTELEPPELVRKGNVYEVSLAKIHVKGGKSFIDQVDITDERYDEDLCGLASSLVTVPTDDLMEEWNEWFSHLKGQTFITKEEFDLTMWKAKREIANLKLHQEANKRVKNGITFGTDFDTSFGIDIDFAKTMCRDEVVEGQTNIITDDAAGFKVGDEVTIYDDINILRTDILDIDENTIVFSPMPHGFKAGVNIARTMAVVDPVNNVLQFAPWGSLGYKRDDYLISGIYASTALYPRSGFLDAGENYYFMHTASNKGYLHKVEDGVMSRTEVLFGYDDVIQGVHKLDEEHILVFYSNKTRYYAKVIDFSGQIINSGHMFATSSMNEYSGPYKTYYDDKRKKLFIRVQENTLIFDVASDYSLTLVENKQIPSTLRGGADDFYVKDGVMYLSCITGGVSGKMVVARKKQGGEWEHHQFDKTISSGGGGRSSVIRYIDGKYYVYFSPSVSNDRNLYASYSDDFIMWSEPEILMTTTSGAVNLELYPVSDLNDNLFIYIYSHQTGLSLYKKVANSIQLDLVEVIHDEFEDKSDQVKVVGSDRGRYLIPTVVYKTPSTNEVSVLSEHEVGYGENILSNDVRFKTKNTEEIVVWVQHDEALELNESKFGTRDMMYEIVDDETQFAGLSYQGKANEVRFTMNRQAVDEDINIKRILGGTI